MGIDVQLRRPLRHKARFGEDDLVAKMGDPRSVFADLLMRTQGGGRTPILDRAYPYADLVVFAPDFPALRAELAVLDGLAADEQERSVLGEVAALTEQGIAAGDLELHFLGD